LIHSDILLTAAHCDGTNIPTGVIVGAYQNGQATFGAQARQVVERSRHPKYSSSTDVNDYMVMRINSPVTGVTPVTLNSNSQVPANGDTLTVIGFGDLKSGAGSYPTFLQEVNVPFVPQDKCNQQYAGAIDSSTMICAGSRPRR
jgi:secreted trypsin-like serine protease